MQDDAPRPLSRPRPARMLWITAVWGGCFVAIRWGLRDAPVLWFATLRSVVAGLVLLAIGAAQRRPHPVGKRSWSLIGLLALSNSSVAFAAMFAGVDGLATGTAAVLANAQPLLILMPAWWLYGERVNGRTAVGMLLGFVGLLMVALPGGGGTGAWLSVFAAVAITGGTLLSRQLTGVDIVQATGWHFLVGGVVLAVVASGVEGLPAIRWTPRFLLVLAFLAVVGTALAFLAWFQEVQRSALGPLAAWTFLTPLFGVAFGLVLTDERPGTWAAVGTAVVLLSLWTVVRAARLPPEHQPRLEPSDG